ncbi:MAG: class II aldolase/adducin family protein [Pseudomonadota bacterium]
MGDRRTYLIDNLVKICRKLDSRGFGANHDGNVSVKYQDTLLATPTSESKGAIAADMIITLDMDGKKIEGIGKPFSEIQLHLAAYRAREEISAVVHAHPPFATAQGLTGQALRPCLPEAVVSIGDMIPVAPYAMPGAEENSSLVAEALDQADVFMMQGNGVLSTGPDIEQAYLRLELVEHIAKIQYYAQSMGKPFTIPTQDMARLLEKRASIGLGPKAGGPPAAAPLEGGRHDADAIRKIIADEIRKVLKGES